MIISQVYFERIPPWRGILVHHLVAVFNLEGKLEGEKKRALCGRWGVVKYYLESERCSKEGGHLKEIVDNKELPGLCKQCNRYYAKYVRESKRTMNKGKGR